MDMKRILQAMDGVSSKPAEGANDMKKFLQIVEGTNPHKVALPVQMAMQHYQEVKAAPAVKEDKLFKLPETSKLYTYYEAAEKKVTEQNVAKKKQISETARAIAKRVLEKENTAPAVNETEDYEGSMAKEQLVSMAHHALELAKMMDENTQLDAWVQSKISVASDYIQTVTDFLKYGHQEVDDTEQGVDESRDAYQRDYDSSVSGFGKQRREIDDEANLMYIYRDGRVKQRMIDNHQERDAHREGFRGTPEEALRLHHIIRSKFDPKKWVQKQGTQWVQVHPFGKPEDKV